MVQEPSPQETKSSRSHHGQDSLESLIISLIELKSNIMRVEDEHPALGNDLSSLCDIVIDHLNRPDDDQDPSELSPQCREDPGSTVSEPQCNTPAYDAAVEKESPPQKKNGALVVAFDWAGDHLVHGLDKMGDGVIYVFEKLISLGSQGKKEPPEETAA